MIHKLDKTGYSLPKAWCVPSTVAMLTNRPLAEIHSSICQRRGEDYSDMSVAWEEEALLELAERGWQHREIDLAGRYPDLTRGPTIARLVRELQPWEVINPVLLSVPNHVILTHMGMLGDNWTERPVPLSTFPKIMRTVQRAFVLTTTSN